MTVAPYPFTASSGTLPVAGERWGDGGDRPPVVLLHGGGQTRHSWTRTARRLADTGWTALALDARGHGDSDWSPEQDYSLGAFVGDLVAVVATLDAPPVLVGASLGGMTALTAIGEQPGLARALVLVDVVVQIEPTGVDRIHRFMTANADGFASLEEVADAIAAYNPHRPRPQRLDGLRKNLRRRDDGRWYWHWDPAFMQITDEPQRWSTPTRLQDAADRIEVPTLVVRGARSDVVSDAGIADIRRRIPHAEIADVASAGHMVAGDDNDVFGDALERFLGGLA